MYDTAYIPILIPNRKKYVVVWLLAADMVGADHAGLCPPSYWGWIHF